MAGPSQVGLCKLLQVLWPLFQVNWEAVGELLLVKTLHVCLVAFKDHSGDYLRIDSRDAK